MQDDSQREWMGVAVLTEEHANKSPHLLCHLVGCVLRIRISGFTQFRLINKYTSN